MRDDKRIAVVIPAHDEAVHIAGVIATLPAWIDDIVVVDDGSRDATTEQARAGADPRLTMIRHDTPSGVGGATLAGYRAALDRHADVIVKMDGDGQMDPAHLPALVDAIRGGAAYVKGNRFLDGRALRTMPALRLAGNVGVTFLCKLASGYWQIFDPSNGYTAIDAGTLRQLPLGTMARDFFFESDMLIQLGLLGVPVRDVPIAARYGTEASDLSPLRVGLTFPQRYLGAALRRVWVNYVVRDFSPIALFLALGGLLSLWGIVFGSWVWARSLMTGEATATGTIMLVLLPLILGFQLLLQAFVLDIQHAPR